MWVHKPHLMHFAGFGSSWPADNGSQWAALREWDLKMWVTHSAFKEPILLLCCNSSHQFWPFPFSHLKSLPIICLVAPPHPQSWLFCSCAKRGDSCVASRKKTKALSAACVHWQLFCLCREELYLSFLVPRKVCCNASVIQDKTGILCLALFLCIVLYPCTITHKRLVGYAYFFCCFSLPLQYKP